MRMFTNSLKPKVTQFFLSQDKEPDNTAALCLKICPLISPQCLFLIWCMAPVTWNGSDILYKRVIRPFFLKHESTMDNVVSDLSAKAKTITDNVAKEGETTIVYMQVQPHLYTLCAERKNSITSQRAG